MKYELRDNQGIPVALLALMEVATGLNYAKFYYNQHLMNSDFDTDRQCDRTCVCHPAW